MTRSEIFKFFSLLSFMLFVLSVSPLFAQEISYDGTGNWNEKELGNHRAVIRVLEDADAVFVHVPWRREDDPEKKNVIITDAASGKQVENLFRVSANREFGDFIFQPATGKGVYYLYYLPHKTTGSWYFPNTIYPDYVDQSNPGWKQSNKITLAAKSDAFPAARVLRFESVNNFNSFDPMEIVATNNEVQTLLNNTGKDFLLFPEDRKYPVRMTANIPQRWITGPENELFEGTAWRNEFYVYQIGVFAAFKPLKHVKLSFSDLEKNDGQKISASAIRCINLEGIDWLGKSFKKEINVEKGKVQAFWIGLDIKENAAPGIYTGTVIVSADGINKRTVHVQINILDKILPNRGYDDLFRMARLNWLDSKTGLNDNVYKPYLPIEVNHQTVKILGRTLSFDKHGLPEKITSSFSGSNDAVNGLPKDIIIAPIQLIALQNGKRLSWKSSGPKITKQEDGLISWSTTELRKDAQMQISATMECDGYVNYEVKLIAQKAITIDDIQLLIPFAKPVATYMMGLGFKGGRRPENWDWKWDSSRANNMVWIGDVNAGLQCKLKNEFPDWAITNFEKTGTYKDWSNEGLGGCTLSEQKDRFLFKAFTGRKSLNKGEILHFNFGLLITPLKTLDKNHWSERYFQPDAPAVNNWLSQAVEKGANVINIHQGNILNPYINYPFVTTDTLKRFISKANAKNIRSKIYYTIRELSNHAEELWAFRSLGDEIYTPGLGSQIADQFADDGAGGNLFSTGGSWLVEHLYTDYDAAWHTPLPCGDADMAIRTQGLSRLHNYYLEGLGWLVKNTGVRGIYLDGVGYDREIMKRVRKVLDSSADSCLIDFHSGNNFTPTYGLNSPANQYMELFPYINSLWLGEMYNYNDDPDYWLTEISGIPFGLFSEMLDGCGNAWRGMVYGMTSRLGWLGCDPSALWKLWDEFGIKEAKMTGYWDPEVPVKCNNNEVKISVYQRKDKTLIAYASWAKQNVQVRFDVNWKVLNLNPEQLTIVAPQVQNFQEEKLYHNLNDITVPLGKGGIIILEKKK